MCRACFALPLRRGLPAKRIAIAMAWACGLPALRSARMLCAMPLRERAFDNFPLEPFGNRVPEFVFEVS